MCLRFRNYVFQKRFVKFDGKNLMYFGSEKVGIPVRFRATSPGQTGSFWVGLTKGGTQNHSRKKNTTNKPPDKKKNRSELFGSGNLLTSALQLLQMFDL